MKLELEALEREIRRQVDTGLRPSIQVAVDWRGERVLDFAYGDGATPRSSFVLWSSVKPFVSTLLLQLVDEGRIGLDDRVGRTIPEFATHGKQNVTVEHLLTHRGGFPDNTPELRRALFAVARDWDAALGTVYAMPAVWEPGRDRGYHPLSAWFVIGELVRRLDDRPLAESLRVRLLDPLGIERGGLCLGTPEELESAPMRVRTRREKGAPSEEEAAFWNDPATHRSVIPGASGIGRASELVKLYRAYLDGGRATNGRILSESMVRRAIFPHAVGIPDRTFLQDIPWGLGFHMKHARPTLDDCGTRATPGTFGHGGHFLVNTAWADPAKDLAAAILSNGLCAPRSGVRAVTALSDAIHERVDAERERR